VQVPLSPCWRGAVDECGVADASAAWLTGEGAGHVGGGQGEAPLRALRCARRPRPGPHPRPLFPRAGPGQLSTMPREPVPPMPVSYCDGGRVCSREPDPSRVCGPPPLRTTPHASRVAQRTFRLLHPRPFRFGGPAMAAWAWAGDRCGKGTERPGAGSATAVVINKKLTCEKKLSWWRESIQTARAGGASGVTDTSLPLIDAASRAVVVPQSSIRNG
jgi:hypothetical protein